MRTIDWILLATTIISLAWLVFGLLTHRYSQEKVQRIKEYTFWLVVAVVVFLLSAITLILMVTFA